MCTWKLECWILIGSKIPAKNMQAKNKNCKNMLIDISQFVIVIKLSARFWYHIVTKSVELDVWGCKFQEIVD